MNRRLLSFACFLPLWVIQSLRHFTIGRDIPGYIYSFERICSNDVRLFNIDILSHYEVGFQTLLNFIALLSDNNTFLLSIISLLFLAPISYVIFKRSNNIVLSFVIFSSLVIYHFSFSGLRQAIAIALTVIALDFLLSKKSLHFFTFTLLASLFHVSAIIFLICYPIYKVNLSNFQMWILIILLIIILPILKPIVLYVVNIIFGPDKYSGSFEQDVNPSYMLMLFFIIVFIISFKVNTINSLTYRKLLLLSIIFQSLGLISSYATRIAYYYFIYIMFILPDSITSFKFSKPSKLLVELSCFIFFVFFFFYSYSGGYLDVIPYKFFWE